MELAIDGFLRGLYWGLLLLLFTGLAWYILWFLNRIRHEFPKIFLGLVICGFFMLACGGVGVALA